MNDILQLLFRKVKMPIFFKVNLEAFCFPHSGEQGSLLIGKAREHSVPNFKHDEYAGGDYRVSRFTSQAKC